MSYSQFDEERFILEAFPANLPGNGRHQPISATDGIHTTKCQWCELYQEQWDQPCPTKKRFLEIGAWDPITFSNTRALVELGWRGVMIEPSPGPFIELLLCCTACGEGVDTREHLVWGKRNGKACPKCGAVRYGYSDRITLVLAAVGLEAGLVQMEVTDDALSSSNAENLATWKELGGYYGRQLVSQITLEQIANQFGGFDLISIDAEGTSVDLFSHAMALGWRPHVWVVEIDNRAQELAATAEAAGYRSMNDIGYGKLGNGTNVVWVRK